MCRYCALPCLCSQSSLNQNSSIFSGNQHSGPPAWVLDRIIELKSNRCDELFWLSKRWRTAEALVIQPASLQGRSASADAELLERMTVAGVLWPQNLRHLSVRAPIDMDFRNDTPVPQWVQQVINNTHKAEVLVLKFVRPVPTAATSSLCTSREFERPPKFLCASCERVLLSAKCSQVRNNSTRRGDTARSRAAR